MNGLQNEQLQGLQRNLMHDPRRTRYTLVAAKPDGPDTIALEESRTEYSSSILEYYELVPLDDLRVIRPKDIIPN